MFGGYEVYYSLKSDCFFRRYGTIGHICRPIIGIEQIFDEYGCIFLECLGYSPLSLDEITNRILQSLEGDEVEVKKDADTFYSALYEDGFLNKGKTIEETKDAGFSYSTLKGRQYRDFSEKAKNSSASYLVEYSKKYPFLQTFHIELTSKCNERCIHCYIPHEKKDTDIEYDLMMDVLDQCKSLNVMNLIFSGGEAMLHPSFCDFLIRAKDLDFNVTVLTNLTLLNDDIIAALKYKHIAGVNVSLYSMDPQVHDSITCIKGSFQKTKSNILRLIYNNVPVQINCPIMTQNKTSFYEVIKWGQDNKCAVITDYIIMARYDRTNDNLENRLRKDDIKSVIEKIAEYSIPFQENIENNNGIAECRLGGAQPEERICGVALSTMCMVSNGNVFPCPGWQQYVCGNVRESSLKELWLNSKAINYLRTIRVKDFKKCVGCEDYEYCLMCVGQNYNESKDGSLFDIPQITCDAARINHFIVQELRQHTSKT